MSVLKTPTTPPTQFQNIEEIPRVCNYLQFYLLGSWNKACIVGLRIGVGCTGTTGEYTYTVNLS